MNRSKVYFTDLREKPGKNLLDKLKKLVLEAGIKEIDFNKKFAALKIHFGEPGNLSYIRPDYAACIVKLIKELEGRPFLTDANTLYYGKRANAIDHLNTAMENGFNRIAVGRDVIIADGLKWTEYQKFLLKNCIGCGQCIKNCSQEAIHFNENKKAEIDYQKCIGCGQCVAVCQYSAAVVGSDESGAMVPRKRLQNILMQH